MRRLLTAWESTSQLREDGIVIRTEGTDSSCTINLVILNILTIIRNLKFQSLDYRWYITTTNDSDKIQTELTLKSGLSGQIIYPELQWELQVDWRWQYKCKTTYNGHLNKLGNDNCVFPFTLEDGVTYYGCTKWRVCK